MDAKLTSYPALVAQLAELDSEIAAVRTVERDAAVSTIKGLMAEFSITVLDLQDKGRGRARRSKQVPAVAKYRDPKSGKTWSGRGRQPGWLGDDPSKFLIQPDLLPT